VTLRGTVDGLEFCVQRVATRRGLKTLRFTLGDDDLTCQEAKLTQAAIAGALNVPRLRLAVWHGQQTVGACCAQRKTSTIFNAGKCPQFFTIRSAEADGGVTSERGSCEFGAERIIRPAPCRGITGLAGLATLPVGLHHPWGATAAARQLHMLTTNSARQLHIQTTNSAVMGDKLL
jgi:hypothetical protein